MLGKLREALTEAPARSAAPDKLRQAMKAASRTMPPSEVKPRNIERFPIDGMAAAAIKANNRLVDTEADLMRAEIAYEKMRTESEAYIATLQERADEARKELSLRQTALCRELIEIGALERVEDFKTLLATAKGKADGSIPPEDYVPTVKLETEA